MRKYVFADVNTERKYKYFLKQVTDSVDEIKVVYPNGWNKKGRYVTYIPQGPEGMMKTAVILRKYLNGGKHFCDIRLLNGREVKMVAELFVRPSTQPYVRRPGVVSKSVVNEVVEVEKVLKECG